ncbi:MAG: thiamine phosphate synthase [Nitrospira sp.]|mgnify:CR=1 FL=1
MPPIAFRLQLITDRSLVRGASLATVLRAAVDAGVPAIQLRERDLPTRPLLTLAEEIRSMTKSRGIALLINDRVDLAEALDLDGVHLRASSLPVSVARRLVGSRRILGVSAHSIEEVRRASGEGADYVIVGPVYDTSSKRQYGAPLGLDRLADAVQSSSVPVFAIGGITRERVQDVRRAGAFGVALIGGILGRDDVSVATQEMLAALRDAM